MFGADYLHDHAIQGRVLLPGAAMFELCNAAIACLGITLGNFTLQSVSLSAPCNLQKPTGTRTDLGKVIKCCASLLNGRIDMSSNMATSVAQQPGQIHLSGTSGQLTCNYFNGSLGMYSHEQDLISLPSKIRMGLPLADISTSDEMAYKPSSSPQDDIHPLGTFSKNIPYESKQSRASTQVRPTSTAMILTKSTVEIHHDGYIVHPAILDAVTHTAAALDFEQFLKEHQPSAFLYIILFAM